MRAILSLLTVLLPCVGAFSSEDVDLENCLRSVFSGDFGYTLIGSKPVSLDDCHDWYLDYKPEMRKSVLIFLETVFKDSRTFIFKDNGWYGKQLIHIPSLCMQISRSKRLQDFIKHKFGSEKNFLAALRTPGVFIFELLDRDDVLVSSVLGYGEENGDFYSRRVLIGHYLKKYPLYSVYPFQQKPGPRNIRGRIRKFHRPDLISKPTLRPQFKSLEEEWQWIREMENMKVLRKDPMLCYPYYLYLPHYVSRRGSQSDEIHAGFIAARDRLARLFCGRKISEVVAEEAKK